MRTTLTLDEDVFEESRAVAAETRRPFKTVINEALRAGLRVLRQGPEARPYQGKTYPMGLRPGLSEDNVAELLAQIEGEDHR